MPDRWFRAPAEQVEVAGLTTAKPRYWDAPGVEGFSCQTLPSDPVFIVRYFATQATLEKMAADPEITALTKAEVTRLLNENRDKFAIVSADENLTTEEWERRFNVRRGPV